MAAAVAQLLRGTAVRGGSGRSARIRDRADRTACHRGGSHGRPRATRCARRSDSGVTNGITFDVRRSAFDVRTTNENEERRTKNEERRTKNEERRTKNEERRTKNEERRTTNGYDRVSVIVAFVIGTTHVLDDTVIGPVSVDIAPIVAFIVPVI
jgi:hypothetical protein